VYASTIGMPMSASISITFKVSSEDDAFNGKEEVQTLTKDYEKKVDDLLDAKTKEIMAI
jgi:ribosome recycling factor